MDKSNIVFPLPLDELMKLWLEFGCRIHTASIGEDGIAGIGADIAMRMACDAVAIGASQQMVEIFKDAFLNPENAINSIKELSKQALGSVAEARAAAASRNAKIYASEFGLADQDSTSAARRQ